MSVQEDGRHWLTVREAAVLLSRSYGQTLRLMEIGTLEGRRESGRWLVTADSVENAAKELATEQQSP